jgi:hypothetical protein
VARASPHACRLENCLALKSYELAAFLIARVSIRRRRVEEEVEEVEEAKEAKEKDRTPEAPLPVVARIETFRVVFSIFIITYSG